MRMQGPTGARTTAGFASTPGYFSPLPGGAFPCRLRAFSFKCENWFEWDVQRQSLQKNEAEGQVLPEREEYPEASG